MKINRQQMIDAVKHNIEGREAFAEKYPPKGYAKMGNAARLRKAYALLKKLKDGTPSVQQVVGYFGKGARFFAE